MRVHEGHSVFGRADRSMAFRFAIVSEGDNFASNGTAVKTKDQESDKNMTFKCCQWEENYFLLKNIRIYHLQYAQKQVAYDLVRFKITTNYEYNCK